MLLRRCVHQLKFRYQPRHQARHVGRLRPPRIAHQVHQMWQWGALERGEVTLWITCASMALGAYVPGLIALLMPSKARSSNLASTASAGLLLGAGLCVILPEGFRTLNEAQEALTEAERLPEWAAGAALLAGFMLMISFDLLRPKHDETHGTCHVGESFLPPTSDSAPNHTTHHVHHHPSCGTSSHEESQIPAEPPQLTTQLSSRRSHECCLPECTWKPDVCVAADTALVITDSVIPADELVLRSSQRLSVDQQGQGRPANCASHSGRSSLEHRHVNGGWQQASRHKHGSGGVDAHKDSVSQPLLGCHHHTAAEEQEKDEEGQQVVSAAAVRAANQACVGLVLHSAADGLAVGAAALSSSLAVPITIALSIMAHKMPVGYGLAAFLRTNSNSWGAAHAGLLSFAAAAPLAALATYYLFGQTPWASDPQAVSIALLASGGTVLHAGAIHVLPTAGNRPIDLLVMLCCSLIPLIIGALIPEA